MKKEVEVIVYGANQLCPSCIHLPSSKETYEWLEAALKRKYPEQPFTIRYVDFTNPEMDKDKEFSERIVEEDLFYPVVTVEGEIVGEGNPRLKTIYKEMEQYGYEAK
ncbi:disulfide oxidoreductase [Lottiidibacillus patelloidae]|uniref:Disulfide oxidoreductase n=1 Tax=Lottiidibacillus patelloidae TaxID=2670334 RepID=A0A263BQE6_9BACI|nr:YuzD family protein [Lottiidibacillus patelloidae]OZM55959.1 disulfide oxidoreductase [Lottiidibacillus patelloidae]